jgi:hypothetical protein
MQCVIPRSSSAHRGAGGPMVIRKVGGGGGFGGDRAVDWLRALWPQGQKKSKRAASAEAQRPARPHPAYQPDSGALSGHQDERQANLVVGRCQQMA